MQQMDQAAAAVYSFTPPVTAASRSVVHMGGDNRFSGPDVGSRNDANAVQATPKTVPVKHYVIIDASQRNWVLQPNPYSNLVYSFGVQTIVGSNPPVYTNNPFVPTFGANSNGVLNSIPGVPNNNPDAAGNGWYLPIATPASGTTGVSTTTNLLPFPAYNSSLPLGNLIGYDTGYSITPSGLGFGSVFLPSNVQSIRLVRSLLPQQQFLSVPVLINSNFPADSSLTAEPTFGPGGTIQTTLVNTAHSTFATYPYLLFGLNEYYGKYVGGNETIRRSFSVMTQSTRTQTTFQTSLGVQYYNYEPWSQEALVLQSPITNLNQIKITVTDPNGGMFTHLDSLSVVLIQTDSDGLFLKCITGTSQYFSSNDIRVGDRIVFDPLTLCNIIKSPLYSTNSDKVAFAKALSSNSYPVLQLLDYVRNNQGQYVARTAANGTLRTASYAASFNGFMIPNFLYTKSDGSVTPSYPSAPDPTIYSVFSFPVTYSFNPTSTAASLPIMNASLQPTYTLELTCMEPDTSALGGHITQ